MSWSKSPKNLVPNSDILIIGDSWISDLFKAQLQSRGCDVRSLQLPCDPQPSERLVSVGNGELAENARLIFGDALFHKIWSLSASNLQIASQYLAGSARLEKKLWFARSERERELCQASLALTPDSQWLDPASLGRRDFLAVLQEPTLAFSTHVFASKFSQPHLLAKRVLTISQLDSFHYQVTYESLDGQPQQLEASVILVLSELVAMRQFETLSDKLIPVTLSSFEFPVKNAPAFKQALFNGGADFVHRQQQQLYLGSYRNLFEDKGVGRLTQADPVTGRSVQRFFSHLGWIEDKPPIAARLSYESITCDGLPLVGPLNEYPGIYVVAGFAARTAHFIFAIADALLSSVLEGQPNQLGLFSLKRFL